MGVTWIELHSDEMPAYVIEDYIAVIKAESEKARRDALVAGRR